MKILLTGSSGFLGSRLVSYFENSPYEVCHLVRSKSGRSNEYVWDFLKMLPDSLPQCNVVIHLAAHVDFGTNYNVKHFLVNSIATAKLAKYCVESDAIFIFASMVGVHGNFGAFSFDSPIDPQNSYGMSKFIAEELLETLLEKVLILRLSGIYGLEGPSHLGLNTAITNAYCHNQPPTLRGAGTSKRNYICVDDAARWIFELTEKICNGKYLFSGSDRFVHYLAGPEKLSIEEYLTTIAKVLTPGKSIIRQTGADSPDCTVNISPPPFKLISFRDYLEGLISKNKEGLIR